MKASIIILTKNGEGSISKCLNGVTKQSYDDGFEVIIIDSGSTDRTLEIIKRYPVKLYRISPDEFGHGKTRNIGASLATGDILVYLSQDAEPVNGRWLHYLTQPILKDFNIGAVYSRQIPTQQANPINKFRLKWLYRDRYIVKQISADSQFLRERFSFSNVSAAIRKQIWESFPFRDEVLFAEDVDFARRILINGYKVVYEPKSVVYHIHNHSIIEIFRRYFDVAVTYKRSGILRQMKGIEGEGKRYVLEELRFLIHNRYLLWIPYSLIHNFAKYFGFKLGCFERLIPMVLKKRVSKYWY